MAESSIDPTSVYEICYETDCIGLRVSNLLSDDHSLPSLEGRKKALQFHIIIIIKILHWTVLYSQSTV